MKCLLKTKNVIVLLSGNGMRFYFPILCFFSKIMHTRVFHDVIGGNLDSYVNKYNKYKKYLNSFQCNWVETSSMKTKLEQLGINNCEVIPNFKRLNIVDLQESTYSEPFRFCIFSRVMKEKGIETAIDAIERINATNGRLVCVLDIYGRIDDEYKFAFDAIMRKASKAIEYKGLVPFDKSVEAIKDYYALLFPTYWRGEGFPGTIVDAFSAGLPVIASDWNCNGEIIENRKNGLLYPSKDMKNLEEAIKWLIVNQDKMQGFKNECIKKAREYQPDNYIKYIIDVIEK